MMVYDNNVCRYSIWVRPASCESTLYTYIHLTEKICEPFSCIIICKNIYLNYMYKKKAKIQFLVYLYFYKDIENQVKMYNIY